ncbi:MAG: hypothetical protein KA742_13935 [Pseudoxanthomonas sp.]|nr:hypothetical protein [Pseudoxanthomonas sp.]
MTDFEIQTTESVTVIQTSETVFEIHSAEAPTVIETPAAQGPAGRDGVSGAYYQHMQLSAADEWIVNHNFGRYPNVSAFSVGGVQMLADIQHMNTNQARITFDSLVSGYAICT